MLHVLSIDWDYFVDADMKTRALHFPDIPNEEYPVILQNIIWSSRYSTDPDLQKVSYLPVIDRVVDVAEKCPVINICDSHKHIYTFTKMMMLDKGEKSLDLLNIDFHHDYRKDMKNVDCGNWAGFLMKEFKTNYQWLGWKDSYRRGMDKRIKYFNNFYRAKIEETPWDMVFICRSAMWSPPHLDKVFIKKMTPLKDKTGYNVFEDVLEDRYISMVVEIEKLRQKDFEINVDDYKQ